mmetsp:Transcript_9317/g.14022  ORF Transcript_9317/g.14022 Transcript_9317/m.14022 type:complete len:529 (-) Transcript_9317:105-1691(-)|eukprot:CAMPEP_0171459538 /NCGR_PEP_ID=MMETSP0945-20130129/4782_1 /TAXON_ID=109269 /ORGANISM="Vaucheria litorea, Strain CCMP2940" /LENGTH=528 /DNA_ID=CAMNT_0011985577 /DNA_START=32 /DNA_END=1618 /DNA_ORIENTATION=-
MKLLCLLVALNQALSFRITHPRASLTRSKNVKDVFYDLYDAIDDNMDRKNEEIVYDPRLSKKKDKKLSFGIIKDAAVLTKDLIQDAAQNDRSSDDDGEAYRIEEKNLKFYQQEMKLEANFKRDNGFRMMKDSVWNSIDNISEINDKISAIPRQVSVSNKSLSGVRSKIGNSFKKIRKVPLYLKSGASNTLKAATSLRNRISKIAANIGEEIARTNADTKDSSYFFPILKNDQTKSKVKTASNPVSAATGAKIGSTANINDYKPKEAKKSTFGSTYSYSQMASYVYDDDIQLSGNRKPTAIASYVLDEDVFFYPNGVRPSNEVMPSPKKSTSPVPNLNTFRNMIPSFALDDEVYEPMKQMKLESMIPSFVFDDDMLKTNKGQRSFAEKLKMAESVKAVQSIRFPGDNPFSKLQIIENTPKVDFMESLSILKELPDQAISAILSSFYKYQKGREKINKAMGKNVVKKKLSREESLYEKFIKFILAPFYKYRQSQIRVEEAKRQQRLNKLDSPHAKTTNQVVNIAESEEEA